MPLIAEFVGTFLLILLGNGVVANHSLTGSKGQNSGWIVITAGWGVAVAVGVYASGHISGGHINPAVTFAFAATGLFSWASVPGYIVAQLAGAFAGALTVHLTYSGHYRKTEDPTAILGTFATIPALREPVRNFVTEVIGTAALVFGVLAILAPANAVMPAQGPLLVGLLVFGIGMSLGGPTGYAINPARDLGPRIAHALLRIPHKGGSDWGYAWIPVVAPLVGGVVGAALFSLSGFSTA